MIVRVLTSLSHTLPNGVQASVALTMNVIDTKFNPIPAQTSTMSGSTSLEVVTTNHDFTTAVTNASPFGVAVFTATRAFDYDQQSKPLSNQIFSN